MRHKVNRLIELETWSKTRSNFLRSLLTSLVKSGHLTTTTKRAKALKQYSDEFFWRLVRISNMYESDADVRREHIRFIKSVIYWEDDGKKVLEVLLPKILDTKRNYWFTSIIKKWVRKWDSSEVYYVKLDI